jgi:hypothetical protein
MGFEGQYFSVLHDGGIAKIAFEAMPIELRGATAPRIWKISALCALFSWRIGRGGVKLRKTSPRPGMAGFAHRSSCFPLPDGLKHGTPVVVVEGRPGTPYATLQDAQGCDWRLFHWQVDCGCWFKLKGDWLPPDDPRIHSWLEASIAAARPEDHTLAQLQDQLNADHHELLERWG